MGVLITVQKMALPIAMPDIPKITAKRWHTMLLHFLYKCVVFKKNLNKRPSKPNNQK